MPKLIEKINNNKKNFKITEASMILKMRPKLEGIA